MYKRILIPLDNSSADEAILTHVRSLARLMGSQLILVHVADGFAARLQEQLNLEDSQEILDDRGYLRKVEEQLIQEGFFVKSHLAVGEPSDQILSIAEKESCDLIAMSTHGHRLIKDFILGSVAENIRHRTNIPVLMIRALM